MGASLTMIDRHYGHLARDGREPPSSSWTSTPISGDVHGVDVRWTLKTHIAANRGNRNSG
jgi:hypothetical protein